MSFYGRGDEIAIFDEMLNGNRPAEQILYVRGDGGIGKTQLIKQLLEHAAQYPNCTVLPLVDVSATEYRDANDMRDLLYNQLGKQAFPNYNPLVRSASNFRKDLEAFCKTRTVVIAFDTFEQLWARGVREWILKDDEDDYTLKVDGLFIIVGSRPFHKSNEDLTLLAKIPNLHRCDLPGLGVDDAIKIYLEYHDNIAKIDEDPDAAAYIAQMVKATEGHPLRLRLAICDFPNRIAPHNNFDEAMTENLHDLGVNGNLTIARLNVSVPAYRTMVYMSYLKRRFTKYVLEYIMTNGFIPAGDCTADDIIDELKQYFFVKADLPEGRIQLHDEVADMLRKHIWNKQPLLIRPDEYTEFEKFVPQMYDDLIQQQYL